MLHASVTALEPLLVPRRSHGRKIVSTPPLFPGYLFVLVVQGWWMRGGPRVCVIS